MDWERFDSTIKIYNAETKKTEVIDVPKGNPEKGYINEEEMYQDEIKAFLDAIEGIAPYPHTFEENLVNLKLLEKIVNESKRTKD